MKEYIITFLAALVVTSIWSGMDSPSQTTPQQNQANISQSQQPAIDQ